MVVLLGFILWAQEVPTNTAVPLNLIMITMMFLHLFFFYKIEQQHGPQRSTAQSIGKIEQITFLQLN
jgi:hypothetical protein